MIVSGKKLRLTIIECGCDINMMIDLAEVADLVAKLFYLLEWCMENIKTKKSTIWAILLQL
uniref:AGAP11 protein n=1 Tax=Homo sapiens TaxID=9606 RepID=Q6P5Q0_HUMAN|nr:AGAP11 protein [Homo sapiens]